jgi:hypothetical protein
MDNKASALVLAAVLGAGFATGWALKPQRPAKAEVIPPPEPESVELAGPAEVSSSVPARVPRAMRMGMGPPYSPANPGPPYTSAEPQLITIHNGVGDLPELLCEKVIDLYRADQEALRASNACRAFQVPAFLTGSPQRQRLREAQEEARSKSWAAEAIGSDLRYRFSTYDLVVKVANAVSAVHERRGTWFRAWEAFRTTGPPIGRRLAWGRKATRPASGRSRKPSRISMSPRTCWRRT